MNKTIIMIETEATEDSDVIVEKFFDVIDGVNEGNERISIMSVFEEMETSR